MDNKPRILFACRANAGRSVTAKVLAERYAAGAVDVVSAGSEPGERVHPEVVAVLADLGLSTVHEVPKRFDPEGRYDVVATMGCGETCPVYIGARYEDWELDDPKDQDEATVRRIVADIDSDVRKLLTDLVSDLSLAAVRPLHPRQADVRSEPEQGRIDRPRSSRALMISSPVLLARF